jgi:3-dehydroquinate dehydratase-2
MKLLIINGPNLNLLGKREPHIYGNLDFESYLGQLRALFQSVELAYYQSNHEGAIIDALQEANGQYAGIILNAASLTHTSVGLADAIAAIDTPVVEVHISNPKAREAFRHHSFISPKAKGTISGLGLFGYEAAVRFFINAQQNR